MVEPSPTLVFPDGQPFARGACRYRYAPVRTPETSNRILVRVLLEGFPLEAVVDTGGLYFVCDPEAADMIGLEKEDRIDEESLVVRGRRYSGSVHRLMLTLLGDNGEIARNEVSTFVPILHPGEPWPWPSFLGFQYCMERFRLGLDPSQDMLYFDAIH